MIIGLCLLYLELKLEQMHIPTSSPIPSHLQICIYMIFIILIMYMGDVMQRPEEGIIYLGRGAKGTCSLLSVCSRD